MSSVHQLADQGRTIVCTIHTPSKQIYELLDSVILLHEGRQTYFGPATKVSTYFSGPSIGWEIKSKDDHIDFVLDSHVSRRAEGKPAVIYDRILALLCIPCYSPISPI